MSGATELGVSTSTNARVICAGRVEAGLSFLDQREKLRPSVSVEPHSLSAIFAVQILALGLHLSKAQADPYGAAMSKAKQAIERRDHLAARDAVEEARRQALEPETGGPRTAQAVSLLGDLELAKDQPRPAARYYLEAAALSADQYGLRRSLLKKAQRALKKAGLSAEPKEIDQLLVADAKVEAHRYFSSKDSPTLNQVDAEIQEAKALYRRRKDPVREALAAAVRAKIYAVGAGETKRAEAMASAVLADKPSCAPFVQQIAHEAIHQVAVKEGDVIKETRALLWIDQLKNAGLDPGARRFARSRATVSACQRYESQVGKGLCPVLSFEATGEWSFQDFSREKPQRSLSREQITRANEHYGPALRRCIEDAVKANPDDPIFENSSLHLSFSIDSAGRAIEVEISPRRLDVRLGPCLRERASWLRYPRSLDGERQAVTLPYELRASYR